MKLNRNLKILLKIKEFLKIIIFFKNIKIFVKNKEFLLNINDFF